MRRNRRPGDITLVRVSGLERRPESGPVHSLDQLLHRHLGRIERDACLLITEAHLCPAHALQPFQGLFDRKRSRSSGHALD